MSLNPIPIPETQGPSRALPDYLPARMVNEFSYCPRLFFYEWVEGIFLESADTIEGKYQHRRVDQEGASLPQPPDADGEWKTRSITLSSEQHRLIARIDLLEGEGSRVTPVDYKHGRPRETASGLEPWPADQFQLAVQAIILRENGYSCDDAIVFYQETRQRVRFPITPQLIQQTLDLARQAWETARRGVIPPPLVGSPKCPGCSLHPVCLPDETNWLRGLARDSDDRQLSLFGDPLPPRKPALSENTPVRRLLAPRSDLRPAYIDTQGLRIGRSGDLLVIKDKDKTVQELRLNDLCQLSLMGNIQITTQAVQALCEHEIPLCYFSQGGWFYGMTTGMVTKNVFLRQMQFRLASEPWFCLRLARQLVAGKIRNQRTLLLRNHLEPDQQTLIEMKAMAEQAARASSLDQLLGIEGNAARLYFQSFGGLIKTGSNQDSPFPFDFSGRNRRPPRDPVNALLSLAYSLLVKDLTVACYAVGFDPMMGFYHQPRFGRPALALDLMEPFRPLIADSAVIQAINTRMVTEKDFVRAGPAVLLKPDGRKALYRAYEQRMDTLVTHPLFDYRVSYRRLLEIQARLLARYMEGEISEYPVFVTR